MATEPYMLKKGDLLHKLASARRLSVRDVWDDPKNADLRARRKSVGRLVPGDLVHFPRPQEEKSAPITAGQTNGYVTAAPASSLIPYTRRFRALDEVSGRAIAGRHYRLLLSDGTSRFGYTDENGYTVRVTSMQADDVQLFWESSTDQRDDAHENEGC